MGWELSSRPSSSADCVENKFGGSVGEHPLELSRLTAAVLKKVSSGMFKQAQDASEVSTRAEMGGNWSETGYGTFVLILALEIWS